MARPRTLTDEERRLHKLASRKRYRERHKGEKAPRKVGRKPSPIVYALYRGDEFIDIGTKYELSAKYGIDIKTIAWCSTPTGKRLFYEHGATGLTSVNLTILEGVDL